MSNEDLLKKYVKEHDSTLRLYQHYGGHKTGDLPSIDEYLLRAKSCCEGDCKKAESEYEANPADNFLQATYYHDKNRLDKIASLVDAVSESDTRFWLKTDTADGMPVLMPVAEETKKLVWGIESMGDTNLESTDRITNVLSFLWGDNRVILCEYGEVLYLLEENSVVVRKEND